MPGIDDEGASRAELEQLVARVGAGAPPGHPVVAVAVAGAADHAVMGGAERGAGQRLHFDAHAIGATELRGGGWSEQAGEEGKSSGQDVTHRDLAE